MRIMSVPLLNHPLFPFRLRLAMHVVDESIPFQVESDASDFTLAATLNQAGRPEAFFSSHPSRP